MALSKLPWYMTFYTTSSSQILINFISTISFTYQIFDCHQAKGVVEKMLASDEQPLDITKQTAKMPLKFLQGSRYGPTVHDAVSCDQI